MAKAVLVTYLIALSIPVLSAYKQECAVGPEYWCRSFETANDCGALRHCTDTVWRYDEKFTQVDSSTTCEWCQKILENTHNGIQHLANNEDLNRESLAKGCELFPFSTDSSKCTNAIKTYGTSAGSLMKHQRYATLCRLMTLCSNEPVTEAPVTETPINLGSKRCTWGPSYWCSSLSNTRECSSIDHCSNKIWSQQSIEKKPDDKLCQYCEFTIAKLRVIIEDNKTDINIEKWLSGACSMLPTKEAIDNCVTMMSQYADEILVLIKTNIDPGVICHLTHMCKDATIITRVDIEDNKPEVVTPDADLTKAVPIDEQSKMLCNVIVQATHELHTNQQKNRDEIQDFLKNDCQKLATTELMEKCQNLVEKHGIDIHGQVASHIELSKICDYIDDFVDSSSLQSLPNVHCELCTFVMKTAKYMLDAKQSEEKIFNFIEEQVCSRFTGVAKKNCREMIDTKGKDLINAIQRGTKTMLLCTHFQVCIDQVLSPTSSIEKNDKNSFLKENICEQLGTFKDACNALIEKDSTRLMKTLFNDMEGDVLCRIVGTCPKKMSLLDNLSVNDDTNKCKRCVDDFTRRKHIAEKLVNHSAEFLHHLCGQLPEKDSCIKTVDESISALIEFVRSLDPQEICVQLKMCNQTLLEQIEPTTIHIDDDSMNQQIIKYIQTEICSKLGALKELCEKTIETEGPAMFAMIARDIDPKNACAMMGVCQANSPFENCNDKCACCMDKIEVHEVQVSTFLDSMVASIRNLCQHMPENTQCIQMTSKFQGNVNQITSRFNAKQICQVLNHCSTTPIEIETLSQCQIRINSKRDFLLSAISSINQNLKSLCEYIPWNKDCYAIIDRSTLDTNDKISQLNSEKVCTSKQSLKESICLKTTPFTSLCEQLVSSDENHLRMEAIFKSMFNQNGNLEKDLCEYQSNDCQNSEKNFQNCKDKCDCCVQFYTTKKNYDLSMIETLRSGFLATCDWSLSKDYCISWFNRVCDRMKEKVDQFIPATYCKRIGLCPIGQQDECKIDGDKCQCCKNRLNSRQNRFRTTVNEITNILVSFCTDNNCRSMVQSAQQQTLAQIDRIDSETYCQRYGYCSSQPTFSNSRLISNPIGSSIEALDDRFEAALSSDICFQYGQLRPMCEHLLASPKGHRYLYVYMALLKNNAKLVDDDIREQMATKVGADVCQSCKNAVQSAKDFWGSALEKVRDVLIRTCERCPVKDQCRDYYNQRYNDVKSYIDGIDSNQFCQTLHLCSSTSVVIIDTDQCSTCVERLQSRKEAALQAITRVTAYFDDLCQRFVNKQCQVFVQQIRTSFEETVQSFDPKQTCTAIGFCSTTKNDKELDFDAYEKYLINELETNMCAKLGPFQSLCKQVIQGNRKQIQTVKINYNIKDLMQIGEEMTNGITRNLLSAENIARCEKDKCQCCIDRVNQKKGCVKNIGDKVISSLTASCNYCPSKDQCLQFWKNQQTSFDSYIDDIDAKQVCTRFGFCNVSTLCVNMGIYQQACEEALTAFTQSLEHDPKTLEEHLPHTSVVVLPTKHEEESHELIADSNATCILCEYVMNILSNYIHQQSTEEEIEQSLQKVCNQMPATLQKQCHELIDNYAPSIIATLIQEFDVTTVCRKLNLCTNQMKVELKHLTKPSIISCGICDYVSTYINFALKHDSSEKSLKHALSTVCTHLSSEQQSQCQTLVQLFSPNIRNIQLQLGKNFCQQLSICQTPPVEIDTVKPSVIGIPLTKPVLTKEEEELKNRIVKNLDDTPQCMLCHYVVTYLDAIIQTNKSKEAVEAALEKVCTILPKKERAQCDEFVKTYGPVLAELISEMADPDTVCRYLGMCQVTLSKETTTTKPITYGNHDYVHISNEPTPYTCTICQFMISRMKHFLALNQTEEEIIASLKQSCDLFAVIKLKDQCLGFLEQYAPYIIQMISSDVQPKVACQELGVCEKNSQVVTPSTRRQSTPPVSVSSSAYGKCIYGMNYWCTSRQNAELCNAVELCERQVWSKKNKNIVV